MQIKIVLFYDHVYRGRNNQVTVYAKLVKNWDTNMHVAQAEIGSTICIVTTAPPGPTGPFRLTVCNFND